MSRYDRKDREKNVPGEKLLEIAAAAKRYSKNIRGTPLGRTLSKMPKYMRDNARNAVPFDRGAGIFVMKKSLFAEKLEKY